MPLHDHWTVAKGIAAHRSTQSISACASHSMQACTIAATPLSTGKQSQTQVRGHKQVAITEIGKQVNQKSKEACLK